MVYESIPSAQPYRLYEIFNFKLFFGFEYIQASAGEGMHALISHYRGTLYSPIWIECRQFLGRVSRVPA
ncbi:MAG: hypothetical protein ACTSRI_03465 [Promethearchaeota archaeon]